MSSAGGDAALIEQAYWLVLNRPPTALELADQTRLAVTGERRTLPFGLLASDEFRRLREAWKAGVETSADPAALEAVFHDFGTVELFVTRAYEAILGRPPDDSGRAHYVNVLEGGERRTNVARALAISSEFDEKRSAVPRDVQLCELANPAKWDNDEWLGILRSLGLTDDKLLMHRKPYEFTQLLYGCRRLGMIHEEASFISIGAGHEQVLYWLSNHVKRVVATDLYEGAWQGELAKEGDPVVLDDPDQYAPFPYRRDHLEFMKMDGRSLRFADESFDVSYSLSSIEHFGGYEGARQTIREMARVLKPGGVLAVATEYVLAGPPHEETFQPSEVHALLRESGLQLVEPIDEAVYRRYETRPVNIRVEPHRAPHMVVEMDGTVFTSVMAFLRKTA